MANNKNVSQCRFYVDLFSYYHAVGYVNHFEEMQKFLYLDPSSPSTINIHNASSATDFLTCGKSITISSANNNGIEGRVGLPSFSPNFIGLFNHNFADNNGYVDSQHIRLLYSDQTSNVGAAVTNADQPDLKCRNSINGEFSWDTTGISFTPEYNGWSLTHINSNDTGSTIETADTGIDRKPYYSLRMNYQNSSSYDQVSTNPYETSGSKLHIGSWLIGRYYDTPHSPNLSITMKREFKGVKKSVSTKGKQFVNIDYDSTQNWTQYLYPSAVDSNRLTYQIPCMEFTYGEQTYKNQDGVFFGDDYRRKMAKHQLGKKGKRIWSISFDYFSDTDMWLDTEQSTNFFINEAAQPSVDPFLPADYSNQLNDYSFQWVWTHTLGGAIPFLFCPDKNLIESSDDESRSRINENMAICTFDNKSLQVKQVAPNLYNVSVSIREI
tara:strand:+ start:10936 stop:12249 length:1314 start_codon:yes stop_codon:yes gene_type:complete